MERDALVGFWLQQADHFDRESKTREWLRLPTRERLLKDFAWLYRRPLSESEELQLKSGIPSVKTVVKPLFFEAEPKYHVEWADSGEGVALFLNAEPRAFVDETTHLAYSKGVPRSSIGNGWDQELFEKLFGKA